MSDTRKVATTQFGLPFERRVFQVGELTRALRTLLEERYANIWVEGELSNFKAYGSGHWYFTLKDESASLKGAMFRRENARLRFRPEDGMAVLCRGRLSIYDPRGEYQLIVDDIEPRGSGALQIAFEKLKARLEAEGLFRAERKRPLPLRPTCVGIVTSPTGAAIRDLLQVMERRDRTMSVLLCPAKVQGDGAAQEIAEAITRLGRSGRVDVIIAGRGGGSIEDLWAFNEEVVARAIAACPVPVVSAVGHEIDFTIADFVADVRAPTPSAAAELVVPEHARLGVQLAELRERARRSFARQLAEARHELRAARQSLGDPRRILSQQRMQLDDLAHRAETAVRERQTLERRAFSALVSGLRQRHPATRLHRDRARLTERSQRLATLARQRLEAEGRRFAVLTGKLHALSPLGILARGYAIARHDDGRVVTRASDASVGDALNLLLAEGKLRVRVEDSTPAGPPPPPPAATPTVLPSRAKRRRP